MQVGSAEWKALLVEGAAQMGLAIDARQAAQMGVHAEALLEWNRKINLTAITDPSQIAVKHFLDAIAPMPYIPHMVSLFDVGTGAGFPGIPLKIMRPAQPMILIDGSRKKINFVKHVLRSLNLPNVSAIQGRVESVAQDPSHRGCCGAIVCRAFADLERIAHLCMPLLSAHGRIYVYQGPNDSRRSAGNDTMGAFDAEIVAVHHYTLPIIGDRRVLTVIGPAGQGGTETPGDD